MAYDIKTQAQFFEAMKNYLISNCDEVTDLNEGSFLRTLFESISLILGDINLDWFIKLDNKVKAGLYDSFNFTKKAGDKSNGFITLFIQVPSISEITIPAGLQINWNGYIVETTEESVIEIGDLKSNETSALFTIASANTNISVGSINTKIGKGEILNKPNTINWAENETAFSGGTDEETDSEMLERFRIFIQGLTRSTVFAIQSAVLGIVGVRSANIIENYPTAGWITIYAEDGDGTLSPETETEIRKVLNGDPNDPINYPGYRAAGIKIEVKVPTLKLISFNITVSVLKNSEYDEETLKTLIKTAVEKYVNTLLMSYDVILTEVITAIQNADEVVYNVVINSPAEDVEILEGEIAKTNVSSITVNIIEVDY